MDAANLILLPLQLASADCVHVIYACAVSPSDKCFEHTTSLSYRLVASLLLVFVKVEFLRLFGGDWFKAGRHAIHPPFSDIDAFEADWPFQNSLFSGELMPLRLYPGVSCSIPFWADASSLV